MQWHEDFARCLGLHIAGGSLGETDARGQSLVDDDVLLLFKAHHEEVAIRLPEGPGPAWRLRVPTVSDDVVTGEEWAPGTDFLLAARSLAVLLWPLQG